MAKQLSAEERTHRRISRRRFIRLAGLGRYRRRHAAPWQRPQSRSASGTCCVGPCGTDGQEWFGTPAVVALGKCPSYADSLDCLRETWRLAGMPEVAGKRVLVKPNLIDAIEGHPTTTAPADGRRGRRPAEGTGGRGDRGWRRARISSGSRVRSAGMRSYRCARQPKGPVCRSQLR